MVEEQDKPINTVTITTQELLKFVDQETAFKFSNWIEWQADEKDKRKHQRILVGIICGTAIILITFFVVAGHYGWIGKEAANSFTGAIIGFLGTLLVNFVKKPEKK